MLPIVSCDSLPGLVELARSNTPVGIALLVARIRKSNNHNHGEISTGADNYLCMTQNKLFSIKNIYHRQSWVTVKSRIKFI